MSPPAQGPDASHDEALDELKKLLTKSPKKDSTKRPSDERESAEVWVLKWRMEFMNRTFKEVPRYYIHMDANSIHPCMHK